MAKLDYPKATISRKPSISMSDEADRRGNDAAARWLERVEPKKPDGKKPAEG